MKTISIRELHTRTGHYVSRAATEPITVAILQPAPAPTRFTFAQCRLRPGFLKLQSKPTLGVDSGGMISEDRDAR